MWIFFFAYLFAQNLGFPILKNSKEGVEFQISSTEGQTIRVRTVENGCLYVISNSSFVTEGIQDASDKRIRFLQLKNLAEDAQILVGFTKPWTCFEPQQAKNQILFRIGAANWKESKPELQIEEKETTIEEIVVDPEHPSPELISPSKEKYLIAIDAGHGGWDAGAVGVSGLREADAPQ